MSARRVMGIETEFGVSVPGHPTMNAMVTSSHIVNSYSRLVGLDRSKLAHWDFERESPLRDARGFDMSRSDAHPSQLTDQDDSDLGLANLILMVKRFGCIRTMLITRAPPMVAMKTT
jgi:proteasome accessory factor A